MTLLFSLKRAGFDEYFKALRPKTAKVCGVGSSSLNSSGPSPSSMFGSTSENQHSRNVPRGERIFNCRNPWFRQFWEQHFKCRFNANAAKAGSSAPVNASVPECKGSDRLTIYEQEGLVPFVGNMTFQR